MRDYETEVLAPGSGPDYKPITLKAMSRRFKVGVDDYAAFRATVKGLVKQGRLDLGKDKSLSKPHEKGALLGVFRRTSKGFGFVRPLPNSSWTDQIYIPIDAGRDASSGDEVLVKIVKRPKGPGRNAEGRVVRVVARATGQFVGTYFERAGEGFVRVDGSVIHAPVSVGDPGAKGARPGDKVALEMVRFPTPELDGEGVITEVLGPRGQPGVDTLSVIRAFNIPDTFDDETLDEAQAAGQALLRGRHRRPARPARGPDRHHRPGQRPRLRRRDHPVSRRAGLLEPRRPHRRRLAFRPPRLGDRPDREDAGDERLPARPRHPDAPGGPLEQPGEPPGREGPLHRQRPARVQRRRDPDRPVLRPLGHPRRPAVHLRAGLRGDEEPRRPSTRGSRPSWSRCSAGCSSWP